VEREKWREKSGERKVERDSSSWSPPFIKEGLGVVRVIRC
jgi:hypothetical protein